MRFYHWALPAFATLMSVTPAIAGPSVNTGWRPNTLPAPECVQQARVALSGAGLDRLKNSQVSALGEQGDYSVLVRCIPEKAMVIFVVAGPRLDETQRLLKAVAERF